MPLPSIGLGAIQLARTIKFFIKLTFLTPWYVHVCVRTRGEEMLVFRKILRMY